jgi:hypothetical protein
MMHPRTFQKLSAATEFAAHCRVEVCKIDFIALHPQSSSSSPSAEAASKSLQSPCSLDMRIRS